MPFQLEEDQHLYLFIMEQYASPPKILGKKEFFSYASLLGWLRSVEAAKHLSEGACFEFGVTE